MFILVFAHETGYSRCRTTILPVVASLKSQDQKLFNAKLAEEQFLPQNAPETVGPTPRLPIAGFKEQGPMEGEGNGKVRKGGKQKQREM